MLKVECESCKAPYQVDERRVPATGLKMRCPKCGYTFLVTDPSKAGGDPGAAAPKAAAAKKATMVGVGMGAAGLGAPPVAKPAAAAAPPQIAAPSFDDDLGLPAVKPAPPKPSAPKAPVAPPVAALPQLDDLDLPALAGDIGLPAPVAARPVPKPAPAPAPAPAFGFDMDLPAVPAHGGGGGFGAIDLPSPVAPPPRGGGFGDLDLPMTKGPGADLPAPKHGGGGFADLPMVQNDLPIVGGGPGLPMARPGGGGGGGFGEIDLPSLQNDLPQPMAAGAHLPSAVSDERLMPHRAAAAGPPAMTFGELDLPLVGGGPAPGAPPPPAPMRGADAVSFGELDLPPDPSIIGPSGGGSISMAPAGPAHAPASAAGGGLGFGEVDLGGGHDAGGPVLGPPPATSAGSFAFQEASLEPASAPSAQQQKARPQAPVRAPSKAPKILAAAVAVVVVGGALLQFTPVGAFGHVFISEALHKGDYAKNASTAGDNARKALAGDTFAASQKAADDLAEARKKSPRSKPLAATAAFFEYMHQVRFGADPARSARAKTFLADIPPKDEVPYLYSAQAAEYAAAAEWAKAKQYVDLAAAKDPKDGIRQDLAILRGEIALAQKDSASALSAFTEAQAAAPTARASFGLARAHYLAKNYPKAREAVDATLKASPAHAGALTLRALLTWELQRDDAAALKDLAAVLDDKARKTEGSSEISGALAAKGWVMLARERSGEARNAFDEAVKTDPRNVSALVGQGEVLYSDSRYTEALTRFQEANAKDPSSVSAILGTSKAEIALERLSDAKSRLTAARAKYPKDMGVALWLAKTEEALGNKKVAEELYGTAVDLADAQNADAINAYAALARFLAGQGRTSEAQAKLDAARSKLPDTPALQRAFGDVAAAQGLNEQAVGHYQAALEKNPADLGTRFRLGQTYRKMNKLDQAAEEFDKVVAIDKEYPGIALERGVLFEKSGDVQKALEQFNAAFQKAPKDPDLKLRVGAAYVTIGDTEKAIPLLKQVYEERPNSAEANHFLGRAYLKQGGLEATAAMRYLQRAVDLDPNKAEYHLYVAWAANEASPAQLGLARKHVDKALALDKLLADGYWQRGVVELREGSLGDAVKDLKKALELKPERTEAHAALAETYEQKNETPAALAEWAKAIAMDDKQATWRWRYGRLLADKGHAAEAAKHLAFAVEKGKSMQPRPGWLGPAAFEAGEALKKTGKKADACDSYRLFVELSAPTNPDRRDALKAIDALSCPSDR